MPGTHDDAAGQIAVPEWPAAVRAGVIGGIVCPVDVEDRDGPPGGIDHTSFADGQLADAPDTYAGHCSSYARTGSPRAARSHSRRSPAFLTPTSKWSQGKVSDGSRTRRV